MLFFLSRVAVRCGCGEIGIRGGLKIHWGFPRCRFESDQPHHSSNIYSKRALGAAVYLTQFASLASTNFRIAAISFVPRTMSRTPVPSGYRGASSISSAKL